MNAELDKKLVQKYPKLFAQRNLPMSQTAMCWGFQHGDGWFHIIDNLCGLIQSHIDHSAKVRKEAIAYNKMLDDAKKGKWGRFNEYYKAFLRTPNDPWVAARRADVATDEPRIVYPEVEQVQVTQVKEKFGTLRFYYSGGDEYISGAVVMAEAMSGTTCETCGSPGHIRGHGYVYTACDKHEDRKSGMGME